MKIKNSILLIASALLLAGCGDVSSESSTPSGSDTPTTSVDTRPDYEKGEQKEVLGTGLMFTESLGYNTKDASIFDEGNVRYVVYDSNEVSKGEQVFAARKATKVDGKWVYQEKHVILKGGTTWDKYIYQPSVVKGSFKLGDETYSYLMAYQGNAEVGNYHNHIGLAVSKDVLSGWVKVGNAPILENPEIYSGSFGYGSPSLVSIDKAVKVLLSYAFGETQLSGTRIKQIDASDLDNLKVEAGYSELPCAGLIGRDDNVVTNATLSFFDDYSGVVLANDGMPSSNAPGNARGFEIAKANSEIISSASETWTSVKKVTGNDTIDYDDETSLGWDELYSPAIVTDAYGLLANDATKLEVCYSTYQEGVTDANYTASLCLIEVTLGE